jgi:hypothetical protein
LEDLSLFSYLLNDDLANRLASSFGQLPKLEYLRLIDMACLGSAFTVLINGTSNKLPNLRYLDISGNKITNEAANGLLTFIGSHKKLVYLDVGRCDMELYGLNKILDGCEITRQVQVLNAERTIAATKAGKKSIEYRMARGSLCLLHIVFDPQDRARSFIRRLRRYLGRHLEERRSITFIQSHVYSRSEIPDVIASIANSPDGVENVYKCLTKNLNDVLLEVIHYKCTGTNESDQLE